jgi:hypothetical protein
MGNSAGPNFDPGKINFQNPVFFAHSRNALYSHEAAIMESISIR